MSTSEKFILKQMRIFTTSLRLLISLGMEKKYSAQFDLTLDNLSSSALMLLVEVRKESSELNVSKC